MDEHLGEMHPHTIAAAALREVLAAHVQGTFEARPPPPMTFPARSLNLPLARRLCTRYHRRSEEPRVFTTCMFALAAGQLVHLLLHGERHRCVSRWCPVPAAMS